MKRTSLLVLMIVCCNAALWAQSVQKSITATKGEGVFTSKKDFKKQNGKVKWVRLTKVLAPDVAMYATTDIGAEYIELCHEEELFCLVGDNRKGFRIYNKAKGTDVALAAAKSPSAGTSPAWVAVNEASIWHLDGTSDEAILRSNKASDDSTRWHIQEVKPNDITITIAEDNPYANNYKLGQLSIAYDSINVTSYITRTDAGIKTLYLPVGKQATLSAAYQYHGYKHKIEGNTITFTNDGTRYQYLWYEHPDYQFYRIPAIITKPNGEMIAFSDYRYCHNDIGFGRVDQYMRMSNDNGLTWTAPKPVLKGKDELKEGEDVFYKGFGDPALVADRESNRILLMTVAGDNFYGYGNTNYWNGKPNYFARTYSEDGGQTWSEPEDITEQIYTLFSKDAADENHVKAAFVGSGKIFQSRVTKMGRYYRLYAALCARPNGNRVIYSDDFGLTWNVLGGADARPAVSGDEPKCEELPDGSVILSSRKYGGRYFNIYTYTDAKTGTGAWDKCIDSSHSGTTGGIAVGNNSTNGEIMIVKAKKEGDSKTYTIVLQSLPFGNGRNGVGLYWKDITDKASYQVDGVNSSLQFAKNWTRGIKVETMCDTYGSNVGYSAYSTFTLQQDGKIGFFYEESPGVYAMVYVPLSIGEITDNAYTEIVVDATSN